MKLKLFSGIIHIVVFYLSITCSNGLLEWLFGEETDTKLKTNLQETDVKYEVITTDEKFLEYAKSLVDLKPLDACHNIVVYNLKKKCGELAEEDLGKLAVQLFNCQSEAEGRPVFPCTSSMTLAECTKSMDSTTWNGYQIVSNRARAMCYASQQIQFRKLTERAVNNLALTAFNHLDTMKEIKSGQDQIHQLATETVRKLFESQQDLLTTHESLKSSHQTVFSHVADNIKQLVHEKSLIATGNKELSEMTENIRQKLDETKEYLHDQEKLQKQNYEKILSDLKEIQRKSHEALKNLTGSTQHLISNHEQMMTQYQMMFRNLHKMNESITGLLNTVSKMQITLEKRIGWVSKLLGGADDKLQMIMCCIYHIGFFFLMALFAAFLQLPVMLRSILMLMIIANASSEINYNKSIDFTTLTVIVISTFIAHWTFVWIRWRGSNYLLPRRLTNSCNNPLSADELRELTSVLGRLYQTVNESLNIDISRANCNGSSSNMTSMERSEQTAPNHTPSPVGIRPSSITPSPSPTNVSYSRNTTYDPISQDMDDVRRLLVDHVGHRIRRNESRSSTPMSSLRSSRASTPTLDSRCKGVTRAGSSCRLPAVSGHDFCYRHR